MGEASLVKHISDTALWSAIHRARESERADHQFRDPFARLLAGDRGEEIAAGLAFSEADSWSWMARTYLFDNFITERVRHGVDMVLNLGSGLDTRPFRMTWPDSLIWIEVDLPNILDYKRKVLAAEKQQCKLEYVPMDIADRAARRAFFHALGNRAANGLVISEGVIIYLTPADASSLAEDLASAPALQLWLLDLASPGLLRMLRERSQDHFSRTVTPLQFAPENGPEFFADHGWRAVDVQSLLKTAARLNRVPDALKPLALLPEDPVRMGQQPWGGVCLFSRSQDRQH